MSLALNEKTTLITDDSSGKSAPEKNTAERLPSYTNELADFHRAFARELTALVDLLPVCRGGRILDAACGDGFYLTLLARVLEPALLVGLDQNAACLALARRATEGINNHPIALIQGTLETFPSEPEFELVWCAQSLYSLPDPLEALRQMASFVRPGGMVAILENDTLHQAILPLPSHIELALRSSEREALAMKEDPEQYYIGRRLPSLLAAAGLTSISFRTQTIDRMAPLDRPLEQFLEAYLRRVYDRVSGRLSAELAKEIRQWITPEGSNYVLREPQYSMSWLNILAWGRRPYGPIRSASGCAGSDLSNTMNYVPAPSGATIADSDSSPAVDGIHP